MSVLKTFLLTVTAAVSLCLAQEITISGTVTDTDTTAISGAKVMLKENGAETTTGTDGKFTLTGTGINLNFNNFNIPEMSASINNGIIYLNLKKRSSVKIITYTLLGKIVSQLKKELESGKHIVTQPQLGAGVYIHKIQSRFGELTIKSLSTHGTSASAALNTSNTSTIALSLNKQPGRCFEDILAVTMVGYLHYRLAITNQDTSGLEIKIISQDAGTVTDVDSNVYHAIRIGDQIWTVENLRVTKYNDSTDINHISDTTEWVNDTSGAYCYLDNDSAANAEKYGALYNWHAVNTGNLAPAGWHVPTEEDLTELGDYLIANAYNWDGTISGNKIGKSLATKTDWDSSGVAGAVGNDTSSNNSSGFSALPGGFRNNSAFFLYQGSNSYWWSDKENDATYAFSRNLNFNTANLVKYISNKLSGFSVRLVKD